MKTLGVVLTLLAVSIVGSLVSETPTQAASSNPNPIVTVGNVPLPVTGTVTDANAGKYTHVGQKPSQVVNLSTVGGSFRRIDPATGHSDFNSFTVPDGFVFVLTDFHGTSRCSDGGAARYSLRQITPASNVPRDLIILTCPPAIDTGFERHYNTGQLYGAGSEVSGEAFPITNTLLFAQGYLVPAD